MTFGLAITPTAADLSAHHELARVADAEGLDLLAVQDHPYVEHFVDPLALIGSLLATTSRISAFPDVANLPLRPPAMLAKTAASLDLLSGGRFELGLGAGAFGPAIAAMGGPRRTPGQSLDALEEAVAVIRAVWRVGRRVDHRGEHYTVAGVHAGPAPAHEVGIWLGSGAPRSLALTGRVGDGWVAPLPSYLPYEAQAGAQQAVDRGAADAGRDPAGVRRVVQLAGTVTTEDRGPAPVAGSAPVRTSARRWAERLARLGDDGRFDTVVFWPEEASPEQVRRFADGVVPATRVLVAA